MGKSEGNHGEGERGSLRSSADGGFGPRPHTLARCVFSPYSLFALLMMGDPLDELGVANLGTLGTREIRVIELRRANSSAASDKLASRESCQLYNDFVLPALKI